MDILTKTEEMVLLAVYQLKDEAYGLTIRQYLEERVGKKFSVGAVYAPLDRLTGRGFVISSMSDPLPERGGRSRRYYQITPDGIQALQETRRIQEMLWAGIADLKMPGSGIA